MKNVFSLLVKLWFSCVALFFAEPAPDTPQNQVGAYPVGSKVASHAAGDQEVLTASGAVQINEGTKILNGSGVLALTLALPVAGAKSAGGDDGKRIRFIDVSGHAHTITTPANGYNGATHISTGAGAVGDTCEFEAWNGSWYAVNLKGFTLS